LGSPLSVFPKKNPNFFGSKLNLMHKHTNSFEVFIGQRTICSRKEWSKYVKKMEQFDLHIKVLKTHVFTIPYIKLAAFCALWLEYGGKTKLIDFCVVVVVFMHDAMDVHRFDGNILAFVMDATSNESIYSTHIWIIAI
jgi:hypothetical protein